ncbi:MULTISPECIES: subclass B1 metallo-beta-lactamase [Flavobacteriaceae]|uniref:subclass B1 metallo-beta-lactamase n=1 Tax=Flavobacteriaceae TaxID=49546 RepID=UPI001491AF74|nr:MULTISPECIES: subclass B1 metallo-beta-lactamase [Allomuricauda]MDC6365577.1 subclass B1 metallo-beta-lactamase [Muricauda sp. AC10]
MKKSIILGCCLFTFLNCKTSGNLISHESETFNITQLSPQTFQHITYLETDTWGKVGCNGLVVIDHGEAIIFDTAIDDPISNDLIHWIEKELKSKVKAIVATHFHDDCLGGLSAFHAKNIPSYANEKTIALVSEKNGELPQNGFKNSLEIQIGKEKIILDYLGEGHTADNIIGYFPKDQVLFGGCLMKSLGAGKGNLADANTAEWSQTVSKVKSKYPEARIVVPGHGKTGGRELLDFTIELFQEN